jgi:pimeloyl-ACP methyl ester carboxylesterase
MNSLKVSACEQWITYGNGPARSRVYSTFALDSFNPAIRRGLILIHGANLMAGYYFRTGTAAALAAGALDNTIVISTYFLDARVGKRRSTKVAWRRQPNEVVWAEGRVSWRDGGTSTTNPTLSSYDYVDELVRKLADKRVFPNLKDIVIAGFSAGGQYVNRYEMANKVDGTVDGVSISYVVADPSSFAWPTAARPVPVGDASPNSPAQAYKESVGKSGTTPHTNFTYGPFNSAKAPNYDRWPYGLEDLKGYTAGMSADRLRRNLTSRSVTYVEAQVDTFPISEFDSSPNADAQGPQRRARGEAYVKYVDEYLGGQQTLVVVPGCSHNSRCVLTADNVLPLLFPPPPGPMTFPQGGFGMK